MAEEEDSNHHVHFSEEVKVVIPVTMMIKGVNIMITAIG